jgi:DNA-binding MarR family transcriptional regulator
MRALAEKWRCDASNVTWLVDRLEERGLVAREQLPSDRRVKTVVLTNSGAALRGLVDDELAAPPDPMLALTVAELNDLSRVLLRLEELADTKLVS